MGAWFLVEIIGFVLLPCFLFVSALSDRSASLVRTAAVLALIGILLNRLNISIIAFKWDAAVRYYPTWMEIVVTLAVIAAEIWVFRWFINRMPVLGRSPDWVEDEERQKETRTETERERWKVRAM
jgi:Ni/Fe-hydrogenase subunit HybB-like protein